MSALEREKTTASNENGAGQGEGIGPYDSYEKARPHRSDLEHLS